MKKFLVKCAGKEEDERWPCTAVLTIYPCLPEYVDETKPLWASHIVVMPDFDPLTFSEEMLEKFGRTVAEYFKEVQSKSK